LQAWLSPEEPEEAARIDDEDEVEEVVEVAPVKNYALKTPMATAKASVKQINLILCLKMKKTTTIYLSN
jgi:hypothetical protein